MAKAEPTWVRGVLGGWYSKESKSPSNPPATFHGHRSESDVVDFPPVVTLGTRPEDTSQAQLCSVVRSRQECRDQGPKLA